MARAPVLLITKLDISGLDSYVVVNSNKNECVIVIISGRNVFLPSR